MTVKRNIVLFFVLTLALSVSAQSTIKLWDGTKMTKKQKWSELTVFLPEKPNTSGISVIICPGGSYYWLDMDNEGFSVAKYLNKHGITAFVLRYRTARKGNHHPAMIQDLERTMQLVKANSQEYGINPDKIGLMGFSAGGHLVGTAALLRYETSDMRYETLDMGYEMSDMRYETLDSPTSQVSQSHISKSQIPQSQISNLTVSKPYFAAMIYPVVSMEDSICHKKSRRNLLGKNYSDELKQMMSLEKNVRPDTPPIFLLHCTGDKTVDYRNSVVFDKALTEKNIKHKFLLLEENGHGGHGFGIQPNGKATGWIDEFLEWIMGGGSDFEPKYF